MCMLEKIIFTLTFNTACASIVVKDTEPQQDQNVIDLLTSA